MMIFFYNYTLTRRPNFDGIFSLHLMQCTLSPPPFFSFFRDMLGVIVIGPSELPLLPLPLFLMKESVFHEFRISSHAPITSTSTAKIWLLGYEEYQNPLHTNISDVQFLCYECVSGIQLQYFW